MGVGRFEGGLVFFLVGAPLFLCLVGEAVVGNDTGGFDGMVPTGGVDFVGAVGANVGVVGECDAGFFKTPTLERYMGPER